MNINSITFDRLIQGINTIISKDRSSLSDEEVDLLKECLEVLNICKEYKEPIPLEQILRIIELLTQFFSLTEKFENFKDLF